MRLQLDDARLVRKGPVQPDDRPGDLELTHVASAPQERAGRGVEEDDAASNFFTSRGIQFIEIVHSDNVCCEPVGGCCSAISERS